MKKILMMAAAAMMAAMNVSAQEESVQPYIATDDMPRLLYIMPAPPAFSSPEFANDLVRYAWGKQQRQDEGRLELAVADAEWNDHAKLFLQWKDAFGLEINETATPEIWKTDGDEPGHHRPHARGDEGLLSPAAPLRVV